MSILVTGGTGFIGSHVVRHLIKEKGESVVVFESAPNLPRIADVLDQVTLVRGDIQEPTELLEAVQKHNVDRIIHLAYILGNNAAANPSRSVKVNCVGTTNVFEVARILGIKRVVYASSGGIFPATNALNPRAVTEDEMPHPNTLYGVSKLFNELQAEFYWNSFGVNIVGVRPPLVLGLWKHSRENVNVPNWGDAPGMATMGKPVTIPPPEQASNWIYAIDAAEVFYLALQAKTPGGRVYNMSSGAVTMAEWEATLRKLVPDIQLTVSKTPLEISQLMSNERLRTKLGFKPRYTVESAIEEYLRLVREGGHA